jgi:antitoxin (DNA-binding transcriptional repressor) of toxin-antitoxin stability system
MSRAIAQVKVSELKNRLGHYLRQVRRGRAILVCDRDTVIARLEPAGQSLGAGGPDAAWIAELERRGVIRRATSKLESGWLAERPPLRADVVAALLREREDGR